MTVFARVWRRNWLSNVLAVTFLVVVVLFASFLHRAQDRQRAGTCAILDRLPANIDPGVDRARVLYDCGAPTPPILFFGHPFPTPKVRPHAKPGVGTVPRGTSSNAGVVTKPTSRPTTQSSKPSPAPSPAPTPKPSPKPSPLICLPTVICVPSLPQS